MLWIAEYLFTLAINAHSQVFIRECERALRILINKTVKVTKHHQRTEDQLLSNSSNHGRWTYA